MQYSLEEAQGRLKQLLAEAQAGETVVIFDENDDAVQLVPRQTSRKPRQPGSAQGQITISDDFDAPLADFGPYVE